MVPIKFGLDWPSGLREEDFKGFCYLWPWRPSWSCDLDHLNFRPPFLRMSHMKFGFDQLIGFKEIFEIVNDDGPTTDDDGRWSMGRL